MTREKGAKGKQTRERLLIAAADEFANRGFYETKISTIVARSELTQPAFYLYFPSKEAIFEELVNEFRTRLRTMIETSRLTSEIEAQDVPKRIFITVETLFRFLSANPHLTRIGLFLNPEADQLKREMVFLVTENMKAEQIEGFFRPELEMEVIAECLIGIVERLTLSQLLPGIKDSESLANQVVNLLLFGMFANQNALKKI